MSEPFVILHLSDAHVGNPKYSLDSADVLKPLLLDLRKVSTDRAISPHLIVFSGDLAYGEIPERPIVDQYSEVMNFLRQVLDAVNSSFQRTPIFIVPGNHDINRNRIGSDQTQW